ncbi:hypothetical protein [Gordonia sihwensis]|uniref:hypothetical protein n=1 Tax=Gordonia sihwensis TaxID=173559 RepID=UPI003D968E5C
MSNDDQQQTTNPDDIAEFVRVSVQKLSAKKSELDEATEAAEKIKAEGEERIAAVTREVNEQHLEALDIEDLHRTAYNDALAEILDKQVITANVLKTMGHQKVGGRKGRKPGVKTAAKTGAE